MIRNQNHDHASRRKRMTTCHTASWSALNDNLLFLVMMQLGVVDFLSFKGVCKSWRSIAVSNRDTFMASKPTMSVSISSHAKKKECYLEDFEGRRFKTIIPHSAGRTCVGLTNGYLILLRRKLHDFWLVNPITRHELCFPDVPFYVTNDPTRLRFILVSSPLVSRLVFVMLHRFTNQIWFSNAGSGTWNHVSSTFLITDLHAFKGKIYILTDDCRLWELILYPEPKLTLLKTKNVPEQDLFFREFASSSENLYVMDCTPQDLFKVQDLFKFQELDFDEMKWVSPETKNGEYALFLSSLTQGVAIKRELEAKCWSKCERYAYCVDTNKSEKCKLFIADMWYSADDCLNLNLIHE